MAAEDIIVSVHPYFPENIILSGNNFVKNDWDVVTLILVFAGGWALILGMTLSAMRRLNRSLKVLDQALVLWFVLSE